MPIFDNEIKDQGVTLSNKQLPNVDLRSPDVAPINPNLGSGDPFGLNQDNKLQDSALKTSLSIKLPKAK